PARLGHERIGALRGLEQAALVGHGTGAHEARHRLDAGVHGLRAGRRVEARPAVGQAGKAVAVQLPIGAAVVGSGSGEVATAHRTAITPSTSQAKLFAPFTGKM